MTSRSDSVWGPNPNGLGYRRDAGLAGSRAGGPAPNLLSYRLRDTRLALGR
jgi:hypothetical protein